MNRLKELFRQTSGSAPESVTALPGSASDRRYFRLRGKDGATVVGVIGTSPQENRAFVALARHFRAKGLPVPQVLAVSGDSTAYLQEDLGDEVLLSHLTPGRESGEYSAREMELLQKTMAWLPRFQFQGAEGLDWNLCYPQPAFDGRLVDFDLNYFKYCFLKASGLEFNEFQLQEDFERLKGHLLEEDSNTFLYRDFQARNVMVRDGEPWFIDFQGGRRGPIYYDVASFIWQTRSHYPEAVKETLIRTYLQALQPFRKMEEPDFRSRLNLFVLFRTLQVLGAYGLQGLYKRKAQFLSPIPATLQTLRGMLPLPDYPCLSDILQRLSDLPLAQSEAQESGLQVQVYSFSYRKGIPEDWSGNGGGYVFDCRAVHNPGRYERFRSLNGRDAEVIRFLEEDGEAGRFLESVYKLADAHVERYLRRGFTRLQLCFGCTGGQHRSVYCAEHTARHLAEKFPEARIQLIHRELGIEENL